MPDRQTERLGVVVIGRNEGERLRQCLESLGRVRVVYVDSGSKDGSVGLAKEMGAEVVELDMARAFCASRARNEGLARLREVMPGADYVQFVDGDCAVDEKWLVTAVNFLDAARDYVAVCGRRRERYPNKTVYNRLCDMEWNTPIGEARECGGDAMMRIAAVVAAGGWNETMIAGEEPELCVRLRRAGGRVMRLDAEMTLHDAAMTRFGQWWKRCVRSGYAFALGACMHGKSPQRHWVKETRRVWFWGLLVPLLAIVPAWWTWGASLVLLLGYPVSALRISRHMQRRGFTVSQAWTYAGFCVLSKFAEVQGQCGFVLDRVLGRRRKIIEYKHSRETATAHS